MRCLETLESGRILKLGGSKFMYMPSLLSHRLQIFEHRKLVFLHRMQHDEDTFSHDSPSWVSRWHSDRGAEKRTAVQNPLFTIPTCGSVTIRRVREHHTPKRKGFAFDDSDVTPPPLSRTSSEEGLASIWKLFLQYTAAGRRPMGLHPELMKAEDGAFIHGCVSF